MRVAAIVAFARNRVMGLRGQLPWHLPEDLKFFREKTQGHTLVVGRKTYEGMKRFLSHRFMIVVSSQAIQEVPGQVRGVKSLEEVWSDPLLSQSDQEIFLIGGARIYAEGWHRVDHFYLTRIDADFEGDSFFPKEISWDDFKIVSQCSKTQPIPYEFLEMVRRK